MRTPLPSRVVDEYAGAWLDASTFEITLNRTDATDEWPVQFGTTVGVVGDVRSPYQRALSGV